MASIRELERGIWLDNSLPNDVRHDVEALCSLLSNSVADLVVSLSMFEHCLADRARYSGRSDREEWMRDAERHRQRTAELESELGGSSGDPNDFKRSVEISQRAHRDVLREKWQRDGGPASYRDRVVFIHARSFVTTLALLQRALIALRRYDLSSDTKAKLTAASDGFAQALPGLKDVRDSAAHLEDRMRGEKFGKKIDTKPVINGLIHAPNGGAMVVEGLNGVHYGGTTADGTYAQVEISDATTEIARIAVQAVFDALPWRPEDRLYEPLR